MEACIVSSNEFRCVVTVSSAEGGRGGIPSVAVSRVLTKWRKGSVRSSSEVRSDGNDVLEAIE